MQHNAPNQDNQQYNVPEARPSCHNIDHFYSVNMDPLAVKWKLDGDSKDKPVRSKLILFVH